MPPKKVYFENLDGLRFLCFLSVFLYHSFSTEIAEIRMSNIYRIVKFDLFGNGNLGVNFFFVLSGFLITYLLMEEKSMNNNIHVRKFWIRRVLRIWPLFYLCVFWGFFIFPMLKTWFGQVPDETAAIGYYLFFLNNFDLIQKGLPDASVLGVLWSVAIEEQFYLVWPVLLYLMPQRHYWIMFVIVILTSLIFRAWFDSKWLNEFHTLSCMGDMATGAFGAWSILTKSKFKEHISNLRRSQIVLIYLFFALFYFFRDEIFFYNPIIIVFERQIIAANILLIILEQSYAKRSPFKMSNYKAISWLGTISYGLYCLHFIGILIAINSTRILGLNTKIWEVILLETALALAITIALAAISYRLYEWPLLRLKEKFAFVTKGAC